MIDSTEDEVDLKSGEHESSLLFQTPGVSFAPSWGKIDRLEK